MATCVFNIDNAATAERGYTRVVMMNAARYRDGVVTVTVTSGYKRVIMMTTARYHGNIHTCFCLFLDYQTSYSNLSV